VSSVRFAPTLSGRMHIGLLFNGLLNFIYAKTNNLEFNVRFDGQNVNQERLEWGNSILDDLNAFGLKPDRVVWQHEHKAEYREKCRELAQCNSVYHCDCREWEIWNRWRENPYSLRGIERLEKYPGFCNLCSLNVYSAEIGQDVTDGFEWIAPDYHPDLSFKNVLKPDNSYWTPWPHGFYGNRQVCIKGKVKEKVPFVHAIKCNWLDFPVGHLKVYINGKLIATTSHTNTFVSTVVPGMRYTAGTEQIIAFPAVPAHKIHIELSDFPQHMMREYWYDGYCASKGKKLSLFDSRTVLRVKSGECVDTAIWFNKMPDLCLTSAIDDQRENVELAIRGRDIEPFTVLERNAASLINYQPKNWFHPVIVDENLIKYSKFVHSPSVVSLAKQYDVSYSAILGYLCYLIGFIEKCSPISVNDIVKSGWSLSSWKGCDALLIKVKSDWPTTIK